MTCFYRNYTDSTLQRAIKWLVPRLEVGMLSESVADEYEIDELNIFGQRWMLA